MVCVCVCVLVWSLEVETGIWVTGGSVYVLCVGEEEEIGVSGRGEEGLSFIKAGDRGELGRGLI